VVVTFFTNSHGGLNSIELARKAASCATSTDVNVAAVAAAAVAAALL